MTDKPRKMLYHYTSTTGAHGILKSGSLWATDINYVNDSQEIRYGLKLALEEAQAFGDRSFSAYLEHGGSAAHHALNDPSWSVTCFCEQGDLLGQWRGYGNRGCSLGFDFSDYITQTALPGSTFSVLLPVKYGVAEQRRILARALGKMRGPFAAAVGHLMGQAIDDDVDDDDTVERIARAMYEYSHSQTSIGFNIALASCKDPAFAEEREWRLLSMVRHGDLNFREDKYGLVPYGIIDCGFGPEELPLREIVVGPGEEMSRRIAAIRLALKRYGFADGQVEVRESGVPFRS